MKSKSTGGASVREMKAAALDSLVKAELAKTRAADASKISRLKALRLARDAENTQAASLAGKSKIAGWPRKTPPARSAS